MKKETKSITLTFRLKPSTKKMLDKLNELQSRKGLNVLLEFLVSEAHDKFVE